MKSIILFAFCAFLAYSVRAEGGWILFDSESKPWTNSIENGIVKIRVRSSMIGKNIFPTNFPAMSFSERPHLYVYGFSTVTAGQEALRSLFALRGPCVSLAAHEMPYLILQTTNGPGIGIAATPSGDLVSWTEHSSPWNVNIASSNRVKALSERQQLISDVRDLKASITNNIADEQNIPIEVSTNAIKLLRKELIDAQTDLKQLRTLFSRYLKQE